MKYIEEDDEYEFQPLRIKGQDNYTFYLPRPTMPEEVKDLWSPKRNPQADDQEDYRTPEEKYKEKLLSSIEKRARREFRETNGHQSSVPSFQAE
jgi:hypothetical protein